MESPSDGRQPAPPLHVVAGHGPRFSEDYYQDGFEEVDATEELRNGFGGNRKNHGDNSYVDGDFDDSHDDDDDEDGFDFLESWQPSDDWNRMFAESDDEKEDDGRPANGSISSTHKVDSGLLHEEHRRRVFSDKFSPKHGPLNRTEAPSGSTDAPPDPEHSSSRRRQPRVTPRAREGQLRRIQQAFERQQTAIDRLTSEKQRLEERLKRYERTRTTKDDGASRTGSVSSLPFVDGSSQDVSRLTTNDLLSTQHSHRDGSTRGAKFVAEFVEFIDLEPGQHSLLRSIMDRYYFHE